MLIYNNTGAFTMNAHLKKAAVSLFAFGMLSMGSMTASAEESDMSISGDIGVYSQYLWRGMKQTAGASSVQGDLNLDTGTGVSANVWFASLNSNSTEFDFTVDYSGEMSDVSYSVGGIAYTYLNNAAANANELYVGLGYGPISATYYYAVSGSWKKNSYIDVALGHSMGGFDLSADFGFYIPSNTVANPSGFVDRNGNAIIKSGLGHLDLGVSKDVKISDTTFTPSFMVSIPTYKEPVGTVSKKNNVQFVGGLSAAF